MVNSALTNIPTLYPYVWGIAQKDYVSEAVQKRIPEKGIPEMRSSCIIKLHFAVSFEGLNHGMEVVVYKDLFCFAGLENSTVLWSSV